MTSHCRRGRAGPGPTGVFQSLNLNLKPEFETEPESSSGFKVAASKRGWCLIRVRLTDSDSSPSRTVPDLPVDGVDHALLVLADLACRELYSF